MIRKEEWLCEEPGVVTEPGPNWDSLAEIVTMSKYLKRKTD